MKNKLVIAALLLSTFILGIVAKEWLVSSEKPTLISGYFYDQPTNITPFVLTDQYGEPFTQQQLKKKWSLIFAGYTSCPDVCPTTLTNLTAAYPELEQLADIQFIFLSVDPKRDDQAKLRQYIEFFNPAFIALHGPHVDLFPFSRQLGFIYTMVGEGENYDVDHSSGLVVISPQGQRVAILKPLPSELGGIGAFNPDALIEDMQRIIDYY